jgi:hypothetical protein
MFQIYVPNQKNSRKKTGVTFLKLFKNAMIRNIKIYNILDIIEISKYVELYIYIFMIFKVQWVQENQGVTFLVIPPKDREPLSPIQNLN